MYDALYPVTYYFYPLLKNSPASPEEHSRFSSLLRQEPSIETEALLYIHIPYCHDLCRFCPFHVRADNDEAAYRAYTDALIKEIQMVSRQPRAASFSYKAVYFGGGSPSIFPLNDIKRLFTAIQTHFNLDPAVEISFEGEPKTLGNIALLDILKSYNVSRISFGLQTFDQTLREQFNINATIDDINRCTANAKHVGFSDINVDMMYDLPGQTIAMLENDLARLKQYDFDSIDYYNLHYYAFPQKFKAMMAKGVIPSKPSEAMHFALAEQLRFSMRELGYHYVADQIFSKTKQLSEYFRLLWGGGHGQSSAETIAIGSSARGFIEGHSYMNYGNVNRYLETVNKNELPIEKISDRLSNDANRGAVFMMKFLGVADNYQSAMETLPPAILNQWLEHGLIEANHQGLFITERGKNWTTNMMLDALEPDQRLIAEESSSHLSEKPGIRTGSF
ncbi:MAG: radical SAM protein [Legionellaceae bacterium]|nr:radical SAM protein [Legionellaceae bacterium]